ncbi:MAG: hypothetical protein ACTSPV_19720, partial [Candidatus Hodarchaeales archaeon]
SFPLTVVEEGHQLVVYRPQSMTITTSERCFVRHGYGFTEEEIWANLPVQVQVFINDEEIVVQKYTEIDWSDEENPVYYWMTYQSFDAGYFEPGIYNWTVVWSNKEGEQWKYMYPLTVLEDGHRISVYNHNSMTFFESERSFIQHGFALTRDEFESYLPVDIQVFLDGEEIPLQQDTEIDWSDEENPVYFWWFYQVFDQNYFHHGIHEWRVVWSNQEGVIMEDSYPLTVLHDGHQIVVYNSDTMTFYASERSFVRHAFLNTNIEEIWASLPVQVQVFIDGEEIEMQEYTEVDFSSESIYTWGFYHGFDAWYFEPGTYEWRVVWSTCDGIVWDMTETLTVLSPYELTPNLVVTIDYSHDSPGIYSTTTFQDSLREYGSTVNIIEESFSIPEDTNVLLLPACRLSFQPDELTEIYNWFYSDGPHLLWIAGDSDYMDWENYFTPDSCNEVLSVIGANLQLSADTVEDSVHNDGANYRVAVQTPVSDGEFNSIFTDGVSSAIMHGPTSVLGYKDGNVVDLAQESIEGVEVIMKASSFASPKAWDSPSGEFDYYSTYNIYGNYPMIAIQNLGEQKYVIVSGEVIFSDYQNMYSFFTASGSRGDPYAWNGGIHDGRLLVNNILNWFGGYV